MFPALAMRLRLRVFLALAAAGAACFAAAPLSEKLAIRIGAMDRPGESRRVHDRPVPRLGGLAIYLGFLAGALLFSPLPRPVLGILWGSLCIGCRSCLLFCLAGTETRQIIGVGCALLSSNVLQHAFI